MGFQFRKLTRLQKKVVPKNITCLENNLETPTNHSKYLRSSQ